MQWRMFIAALLLSLLTLSCGGSGDGVTEIDSPPLKAEGIYRSGDTGGPLGRLRLELSLREGAQRTYDAVLTSLDAPDMGESKGVGTVGNMHIILNFDRGSEVDYYFEGDLSASNGVVSAISGDFIWPDQAEKLGAIFVLE